MYGIFSKLKTKTKCVDGNLNLIPLPALGKITDGGFTTVFFLQDILAANLYCPKALRAFVFLFSLSLILEPHTCRCS